ncbi:hypothetical protein ACFQZI_10065 [Mucilaginibacter lutimaris]|uniref:Uncharacterized protein n=1 Tax=Mucilaginibacter lutimaris TaxID=931629 RepID=A0ABW2ZG60_9SPHI
MSIKSFLKNIWGAIQSLFSKFPSEIKMAVQVAVMVTESVKKFIDSPLADVLTAIIPGDTDDKIKKMLRSELPGILINLKLANECGNLSDPEEITKCAINTLQKMDKDIRSVFLHNLSVLIAQIAADGKLTWSDGVTVVEWYYKYKFKPAS